MRHFWGSLLVGVVLLAGLVVFALVPGAGREEYDAPDGAAYVDSSVADTTACRSYLLGVDRSRIERAIANVNESLAFARQGSDGGMGFFDWVDAEPTRTSLVTVADAAQLSAATPGTSAEVFDTLRTVMAASSDLDQSIWGGSVFSTGEVDNGVLALVDALGEARDLCA